jgi:heme-degrading monooxygenase HmoA
MILEHALLDVVPGREAAFERAFAEASAIIARQRGYRGHRLERCLEAPSRYLLLVAWETLEDHVEGFRGGPDYPAWKALLHDFYDPFPEVGHFETVLRRERSGS